MTCVGFSSYIYGGRVVQALDSQLRASALFQTLGQFYGGYLCMNNVCIVIAEWLNASQ